MSKYIFILVSFLQSCFSFSQNQNYIFKHIDTRNGLAGEEAIGFAQDETGFIWIATDNGLQRFDGENFITFRRNENDTSSFSNDELFLPAFDKEKNLWLKDPDSSVNIFNLKTHKTTHLNLALAAKQQGENYFISYCKDKYGNMWLCSNKAIYHYDYDSHAAKKIAGFPDGLISGSIGTIVYDPDSDNLWIGTRNGLIEFDTKTNQMKDFHFNPDNNPMLQLRSEPYFIFIDSHRNLWVSTWQGELFRYNLQTKVFTQYQYSTSLLLNSHSVAGGITEDKNGNVWIGANSSDLFYYNIGNDSLILSTHLFIDKPSSNQTNVLSMFCDRENNIWIGTGFGIYMFNPVKQKIFTIQSNPFTSAPLPASEVETFGESSDHLIWVSSRDGGGVSVFDEKMNLQKRMFFAGDKAFKNIEGIVILACCNDNTGKFWMSSVNTLISYDTGTKKINIYFTPEIWFRVRCMKCDDSGFIWIGGGKELVKINPSTFQKTRFFLTTGISAEDWSEVRDIFIENQKKIWIATYGSGLLEFNRQTAKVTEQFRHKEKDTNSVCNNRCLSIASYNDSSILIGTTAGISLYNFSQKKFTNLHLNDGTTSNLIQGLYADKSGNIFTSTSNGLYKFDAHNRTFTHYGYEDGIINNQFYTKIFRLYDGRMMIGSINNFIYFNPSELNQTFTPPDVQLTAFKIFDKSYSADSLVDQSNTIHLSYSQNFITIQFASLYFNAPAKIHYYYRLNGVDKNWVNAGNNRFASYTNLNNGDYTFEVKCENDNGVTSKNITMLHLSIAAPFYKTWWFISLCILAIIAIAYSIYAYRMRNLKALAMVRQHIASDLHDDIGSTLNSISVYSEVAAKQLQDGNEKTKNLLEKMGDASRSMIDRMNDIVWAINPQNDDFENILKRMQYFAGELLAGKNILLQFEIHGDIRNIKLPMEKRKNFYLIYKEAINNAYKYSESKTVNASISEKDEAIIMIITDNGKGFDIAANNNGGNGLKNMQSRAGEMDANIEINSWVGKGTRVYLKMKV